MMLMWPQGRPSRQQQQWHQARLCTQQCTQQPAQTRAPRTASLRLLQHPPCLRSQPWPAAIAAAAGVQQLAVAPLHCLLQARLGPGKGLEKVLRMETKLWCECALRCNAAAGCAESINSIRGSFEVSNRQPAASSLQHSRATASARQRAVLPSAALTCSMGLSSARALGAYSSAVMSAASVSARSTGRLPGCVQMEGKWRAHWHR